MVNLVIVFVSFLMLMNITTVKSADRVVSINLCTDQLAMMVADTDQLISVSFLATEARFSAMSEEAKTYRINHGFAEEIYMMNPDLVLAGTFSSSATTDMLRRLNIPVRAFKPANSIADVGELLEEMGRVLGRESKAKHIADAYNMKVASLQEEISTRPKAALYYANSYTLGNKSLAGQILFAAGFDNIAASAGVASGGYLPLEILAVLEPDAVITSRPYRRISRAEEVIIHPLIKRMRKELNSRVFTDQDWICGTPFVLRAIEEMNSFRIDITEG